jgi:hypothetical protein
LHAIRKTVLVAAVAAAAVWALPGLAALADAAAAPAIDGIRCDTMEGAVFHIHQHLAIFDHGKLITIPSDLGRPLMSPCLYWLHTHSGDGIIHVESPVFRTFTLGQLFDVWGQPLSATSVAAIRVPKGDVHVFVNGTLYKGDPRKVELAQHSDIVIEAGKPFHKPEAFTNWQGN